MCEHSQMLAFIGKSLFPQERPTGVNHLGIPFKVVETSPTLSSPEELAAFLGESLFIDDVNQVLAATPVPHLATIGAADVAQRLKHLKEQVPAYAERMQAKYKTTTCGHCGNVFDECYGVEGCWT